MQKVRCNNFDFSIHIIQRLRQKGKRKRGINNQKITYKRDKKGRDRNKEREIVRGRYIVREPEVERQIETTRD